MFLGKNRKNLVNYENFKKILSKFWEIFNENFTEIRKEYGWNFE